MARHHAGARRMSGRTPVDLSPQALRAMSGDALDALYQRLHQQVFACYAGTDTLPERKRQAALERAGRRAAPVIEQARVVHAERVRRLRARARRWWVAAAALAVAGLAAIVWMLGRG